MSTRRGFLRTAGLGLASLALAQPPAARGARTRSPNIVFVFADQLRSHELGCYGNSRIHTPHLDRLAAEGVRFRNAISTYPLCSPFRSMLLTGKYPMANGMTVNDHRLRPDVPSFARVCGAAGYHTAYIGKWHIDGHGRTVYIPRERRLGFDTFMALECTHTYFKSQYYDGDDEKPRTWKGYDAIAQTRAAQNHIRQHAGRPFALFMSWGPPHGPYVAPPEYMRRYAPEKMVLRPNVADQAMDRFLMANTRSRLPEQFQEARAKHRRQLSSEEEIRRWYAGYYAATECLDDMIGELRATLEQCGVLDDTIFVFSSDHGDMLGSHRLVDKTVPFEEAVSIPFLIRYPGAIPAGRTTDALLGPVDIMPTLLGLAGIPCPQVDGLDLSGHATGRGGPEHDALLMMTMVAPCISWIANGTEPWRAVRTKTHTYARFADGRPWCLYDNIRDPYQTNNLSGRPEAAALERKMETRLSELLAAAGDPCDTRKINDIILGQRPGRDSSPGMDFIKSTRLANPGLY